MVIHKIISMIGIQVHYHVCEPYAPSPQDQKDIQYQLCGHGCWGEAAELQGNQDEESKETVPY